MMEKLEKELMDVYSDKENPSRRLFFYRFQDYIYHSITMMDEDAVKGAGDESKRYTATISCCLLPLLDNIAKKLKGMIDLSMKVHYKTYMDLAIKINAARHEIEK